MSRVSDLELQVAAEQRVVGLERYRETVAMLREVLELAGVAHNGDPWYAEDAGINGEDVLTRANDLLTDIAPLVGRKTKGLGGAG